MKWRLTNAPAAVQKSVQQVLKGATLDSIEKVFDDGEISYHVQMTRGALEHSFEVAPDGKVVRLEISLQEAPQPVQKTIAIQGRKAWRYLPHLRGR